MSQDGYNPSAVAGPVKYWTLEYAKRVGLGKAST
jgi:hypothetical protein